MNCIICGSSFTARHKKCPGCGAMTNLSKADFLFELSSTDISIINKHYASYEQKADDSEKEYTPVSVRDALGDAFGGLTKEDVSNSARYLSLKYSQDPEKQYELGTLYFKGNNGIVTKNYSEAFRYFNKAAKQGNADAQLMLAKCYENGHGTETIEKQALKWYRKAFNNGKYEAEAAIKRLEAIVQSHQQAPNETHYLVSQNNYTSARSYTSPYTTSDATSYDTINDTSWRSARSNRTAGQRIRAFFRSIFNFFRVVWAIIGSIVLGIGLSVILLLFINYIMEKDIVNIIFSAVVLAIAIPLLIWLCGKEFEHLEDRGVLYRWLSRELVITPIVLVIILVGGVLCFRFVPALKYKVGEFQLNQGSYSAARTTFEELEDYNDSVHMTNTIIEQFPSVLREGDIVEFGTYEQDNNHENGKEDIEWQVVYGSSYDGYASYVTLISKNALEYKYFDTNYWEKSSLRYWLNNDFLNEAFSPEQQALLDVTGGYNTDKVDVFAIGYKSNFPEDILHTAPTEYAYSKGSEDFRWCFRWTNKNSSFEANTIQVSYVDGSGAISDDVPDGYFYIRPVVRLKIYAYENQLAYGDNYYTELYNSDLSGLLKTYTGTYVAGQGITCMDFTITSCDKYGNIDADIFFYAHESNPNVPSGRYKIKGGITGVNKDDGSISIDIVGDKWISRPNDYSMLELSITVDSQFSSITGGYQFDLKAVE